MYSIWRMALVQVILELKDDMYSNLGRRVVESFTTMSLPEFLSCLYNILYPDQFHQHQVLRFLFDIRAVL